MVLSLSFPTCGMTTHEASDDECLSPECGSPARRRYQNAKGRRFEVMGDILPTESLHDYVKPMYPKDDASRAALKAILAENERIPVLCGNIKDDTVEDLMNAFREVRLFAGDEIITQGDEGDCLYVCRDGELNVFINRSARGGQRVVGDKGGHVATLGAGALFGELALMYSSPRAATVVVKSEVCNLWALDRIPFKMLVANQKQCLCDMYTGWLRNVDVFQTLNELELQKISDVLVSKSYDDQELIVRQGDTEDLSFYLLEKGACTAYIDGNHGEVKVMEYTQQGEHFGAIASLGGTPQRASVKATGSCSVASISIADFTAIVGPLEKILNVRVSTY
eukprot:TRINITY_DN22606_c0_g1_i2.p1 TRINITY_DN22606_c0_g1~~TRINITY_DN22606_c0_g1_i2.p1  ORF type:complete len:362 (+),score=40.24 TRINITY_DN22606_c0_g1_i2:77-1087(+)